MDRYGGDYSIIRLIILPTNKQLEHVFCIWQGVLVWVVKANIRSRLRREISMYG